MYLLSTGELVPIRNQKVFENFNIFRQTSYLYILASNYARTSIAKDTVVFDRYVGLEPPSGRACVEAKKDV